MSKLEKKIAMTLGLINYLKFDTTNAWISLAESMFIGPCFLYISIKIKTQNISLFSYHHLSSTWIPPTYVPALSHSFPFTFSSKLYFIGRCTSSNIYYILFHLQCSFSQRSDCVALHLPSVSQATKAQPKRTPNNCLYSWQRCQSWF